MVYAPSGDLTDDPLQMSLYIADSGLLTQQAEGAALDSSQTVDAGEGAPQTPGNITEFSFSEIPAPAAAAFVADLVQTIDTGAKMDDETQAKLAQAIRDFASTVAY